MKRIAYLMAFLLTALLLNGCTTTKERYYSYKTGTYIVDTIKQPFYYNHLISYGDYLFEFRYRIKLTTPLNEDAAGLTAETNDTIGVYLLSGKSKLFYEFDTFDLKNRIVRIGRLENKPSGQSLAISSERSAASKMSYGPMIKEVSNNIPYFVTEIFSDEKAGGDSLRTRAVLIKDSKFNSFYKISGIKFPEDNYCIIGFQIKDFKHKQTLLQEIELMRPLNEKEKEICANMIKASKGCVTDTIANFHKK